jgi:hypothetical protein
LNPILGTPVNIDKANSAIEVVTLPKLREISTSEPKPLVEQWTQNAGKAKRNLR